MTRYVGPGGTTGAAAAAAPASIPVDTTVDLAGLLDVFARRKLTLLFSTLVGIGLAVAVMILIAPRFTAVTEVLVDPREQRLVQNEVLKQSVGNDPLLVDSQIQIITSEAVLKRVVVQEKLTEDAEVMGTGSGGGFLSGLMAALRGKGPEGESDPVDEAVRSFAEMVKVARAEKTYVLEIHVTSRDPVKAARLADAVAAAYLADQNEFNASFTRRAAGSIQSRVAELQTRLRESERKVEEFKVARGISNAEGRLVNERQLSELSNRLSIARARTLETKARYEAIDRALKTRGDVSSVLAQSDNPTMVSLRSQLGEASRALGELQEVLGPRHPRVVGAEGQVSKIRSLIREEAGRVAAAARDEYEAARMSEADLAAGVDKLKSVSFDTNKDLIRLRELERESEANRAVYEAFLVRAKETAEQETLPVQNARVLAAAAVPTKVAFPPRVPLLAAGAVGGLGIGVVISLLGELLRQRREGPRYAPPPQVAVAVDAAPPVEAAPRTAQIAPLAPRPRAAAAPPPVVFDDDRFDVPTTVVVALKDPQVAADAALRIARGDGLASSEGALLVDLSGVTITAGPGLSELSLGRVALGDIIEADGSSALHFVHRGHGTGDAYLRHPRVRKALSAFGHAYRRVVVNAGQLTLSADIAELMEAADHVVLAVGDRDDRRVAEAAYTELARGGFVAVSLVEVPSSLVAA